MLNNVQILIQHGETIYEPVIEEGIEWETERKGVPGKLTFNVVKDNIINFTEGNKVKMTVDGTNLFSGFVFTKQRSKDGIINVTAYDQLRYLKNKHTMKYEGLSAAQLIRQLAANFKLQTGVIEDTEYVIPKRIEDNQTLFDIIQSAIGMTLENKKRLYVLYDDFGKLVLKNIENMKLNFLIDADTAENYSYTSSIDSKTYNRIQLYYENKETGEREFVTAPKEQEEFTNSENIKQWGVLQYCDSINEKTANAQAKADALLGLYNKKTRNLSINNAFGDVRVRAGTSVGIRLDLGDIIVNKYMLVERAKHVFKNKEHSMDLSLRGSDFYE